MACPELLLDDLDRVGRDLRHVEVDVARIRSDPPPGQRGSSDQHDRRPKRLAARPRDLDETCDDDERVIVRQELGRILDATIVGSLRVQVKTAVSRRSAPGRAAGRRRHGDRACRTARAGGGRRGRAGAGGRAGGARRASGRAAAARSKSGRRRARRRRAGPSARRGRRTRRRARTPGVAASTASTCVRVHVLAAGDDHVVGAADDVERAASRKPRSAVTSAGAIGVPSR